MLGYWESIRDAWQKKIFVKYSKFYKLRRKKTIYAEGQQNPHWTVP